MKTIGILGGMSAASTQTYYRELCLLMRERMGGLHSPELLIRSLDFAVLEACMKAGEWDAVAAILNLEAMALERGGADVLLIATNTMHKLADRVTEGVTIPLLHIADVTAAAIVARGLHRPLLLATAFTMEETFYLERLRGSGLQPLVPDTGDRARLHGMIFDELCRDVVTDRSREACIAIAEHSVQLGADSVILGCTELGMLLREGSVSVPVFDTTLLHCRAAMDFAFST